MASCWNAQSEKDSRSDVGPPLDSSAIECGIVFTPAPRPAFAGIALRASAPFRLLATALLFSFALPARADGTASVPAQSQVLRSPRGITEVGALDGIPYRIDVPADWNRDLVVFYHGYARQPVSFHIASPLADKQMPFYERHDAVIQSAYSRTGWALQQGFLETEALRRYFVRRYGQPRATFAVGRSMGGQLVAITLEINPRPYAGGLDLCGSVGPSDVTFNHRFAMRAAFDYYFPNLLPPLATLTTRYLDTLADRAAILSALQENPSGALAMRNLTGLRSDADLAQEVAYWTFGVQDLEQRAGGNPFDNRNFIYAGAHPANPAQDFELNAGVRRYASSPRALAYLVHHYTPTGRLGKPMLALHTIYDPVVPMRQLELYQDEVQAAGAGQNLVQQVVDRQGHCDFTQEEVGEAFDQMVRWSEGGSRPTPGALKSDAAMEATLLLHHSQRSK